MPWPAFIVAWRMPVVLARRTGELTVNVAVGSDAPPTLSMACSDDHLPRKLTPATGSSAMLRPGDQPSVSSVSPRRTAACTSAAASEPSFSAPPPSQ